MFLQIVAAEPRYASSALNQKLRDLITLNKEDVVRDSFGNFWSQFIWDSNRLPPYSVEAIGIGRHRPDWLSSYARLCFEMQALYSEMTYLWNSADEIPAECHHAILEHYLFVLISSVVCRYSEYFPP